MNKKPKNALLSTITSSPGFAEASAPPAQVQVSLILNMKDYGARYGMSTRTVYKWIVKGLPHLRITSRTCRIPVVEADRWMNDNYYRQREC